MINTCLSFLILTLFMYYFKKFSVIKQTVEIRCTFSHCTSVYKVALRVPLRSLSRRYYWIKPHDHYHTARAVSGSSLALEVFLSCARHCFPSFYNTADQFKPVICGTHEWGITTIVPGWKEAPTHSFQSSVGNQSWMSHVPQDQILWLTKHHQMVQTRAHNHSQILERVFRVSG